MNKSDEKYPDIQKELGPHITTLRIPKALYLAARLKAMWLGTTVSAVTRDILAKWVREGLPEQVNRR